MGEVPDHDPGEAVRACPCWAVPLIVGADVLLGTVGGPGTTAVTAESAEPEPPALAAVTTDRSVSPTSELWTAYVFAVAPLMFEQLAPEVLQSCHW
jgi:hypothetical protein